MKIIYYCYGGSHSSVTAAGIHLGLLPLTRIPTPEELLAVPYYDSQAASEHGEYHFMGIDEKGNEVFIIGVKNMDSVFASIVADTLRVFGVSSEEYKLVNSLAKVNNRMRVGGFLSRRLGLVTLGRPLVIKGTQAAYWDFVSLVEQVKNRQ